MVGLAQVVLAGGSGSRLWPVSRQSEPKQFMLVNSHVSLLHETLLRAIHLNISDVLTITNRDLFFQTRDEYQQLIIGDEVNFEFHLEPMQKNTLAAISFAAFHYASSSPETLILVTPADHKITDLDAYSRDVHLACEYALQGKLVTFGIQPSYAETGYGYMSVGGALDGKPAYPVTQFEEKPNLKRAQELVDSGEHYWNSGIYCFKASSFLKTLQILQPSLYEQYLKCWQATPQHLSPIELPTNYFESLPDISIDHGLMEKANNLVLIKASFKWSDVGSWASVAHQYSQRKDDQGNIIIGQGIAHESQQCFIHSSKRLVTAVGLTEIIIIDTEDALLVIDKHKVQQVKELVKIVAKEHPEKLATSLKTIRPWGHYVEIHKAPGFKLKKIVVDVGGSLSLQMHHHRAEHWVVIQGQAKIVRGSEEFLLEAEQHLYIPVKTQHRLTNIGLSELVLIEVQTGDYLEEDDIVRFTDIYGRQTTPETETA